MFLFIMIYRVEVFPQKHEPSKKLAGRLKELGVLAETLVFFKKVYFLDGDLDEGDVKKIIAALLVDPVIETFTLSQGLFASVPAENELLIVYNAGVSDPVGLSLEKAIGDLALKINACRTGRYYRFQGLSRADIDYCAPRLLYNPLIEHALDHAKTKHVTALDEFAGRSYQFALGIVDILAADEKKLEEISRQGCLSLDTEEMRLIQGYFKKLGRNPTDCELETIATLWSEHCSHKTFRGIIDYQEKDLSGNPAKREKIDGLLKTTIMKATKDIASPACVSVFHDNAGIVEFDKKFNICFKVETHNHPSSLEPYGGASTGIGGVIRDILGTGCAAKPFANIDVFCFSPWQIDHKDLPKGLIHPKRLIKGVCAGVRDYGNRMGIPTVAGAVLFDERFLGNPLVYCGTLGILPKEKSFKKVEVDDVVVLCGARTGRDGIHGATFSSKELDEDTIGLTSAVQIGNAIEEKKVTEAILRARDADLFGAITDCGAGGLSSAASELCQEHGLDVWLDKVPLKYKGLSYTEIWISESQERMVFTTKEENLPGLEEIFKEEDVGLTVIGRVTGSKKIVLWYQDKKVCELDNDFIFVLPKLTKQALWSPVKVRRKCLPAKDDYNADLKRLLASPNIACKDWVAREYDHEVQAASVCKAINGIETDRVADSAILRPDFKSDKCVAVGLGINPFYSDIDPYWMAALAMDEALRNVTAAGADLKKTYILDNFSWASPQDPQALGGLVRACKACYDFAVYFGVPFISGKDSLYNEYTVGDKRIVIPGTLLISAVSVIDDWQKTMTANFKKAGDLIYLVGLTKPELGASEYFRQLGVSAGLVPKVANTAKRVLNKVSRAIRRGLVSACHDLSEGGLSVALAEMCIGSGLGAGIFLAAVPAKKNVTDDELLFSESPTRFIVAVDKDKKPEFEKAMKSVKYGLIGCVAAEPRLEVFNRENKKIIDCPNDAMRESWTAVFDEFR